jgi:hypothetical protein
MTCMSGFVRSINPFRQQIDTALTFSTYVTMRNKEFLDKEIGV